MTENIYYTTPEELARAEKITLFGLSELDSIASVLGIDGVLINDGKIVGVAKEVAVC